MKKIKKHKSELSKIVFPVFNNLKNGYLIHKPILLLILIYQTHQIFQSTPLILSIIKSPKNKKYLEKQESLKCLSKLLMAVFKKEFSKESNLEMNFSLVMKKM
jgi:hypothetical protein